MQNSSQIEIRATPAEIWKWLENPKLWKSWLAEDGPLPRVVEITNLGDNRYQAVAIDGQIEVWQVIEQAPEERISWRLQEQKKNVFNQDQINTITLFWKGEKQTIVEWTMDWQRHHSRSWQDAIIDWLIGKDIDEMMDISLLNLVMIVEGITDSEGDKQVVL